MSFLSDLLMKLSPHDEARLEANTKELERKIQHRDEQRKHAAQKGRDYLDMQLDIMRRK